MQVMSLSAPSSPRHLPGCFFSAPTSPRRISEFYRDFDDISTPDLSPKSMFIPFNWEEKPGTPKSPGSKSNNTLFKDEENEDDEEVDFAFDVGDRSETASLFAEELFDGGKIKPLKPPPRLQLDEIEQFKKSSPLSSPRSPRSPISQGKTMLRKAFSPKKKPLDVVDPFEAALEKARNGSRRERGREKSNDSNRRTARSLSPFRVSAYPWEEEEEEEGQERGQKKKESEPESESESSLNKKGSLSSTSSSSLSSMASKSRKWRLRDFLLFRSASEGRAKQRDSIARFTSLFKKQEDVKSSSSGRSRGSSSSSSSSSSVSPHEFHYMTKKAESKDMKKRTFLPYKQIGRFAF